jgi:hypothetical protein
VGEKIHNTILLVVSLLHIREDIVDLPGTCLQPLWSLGLIWDLFGTGLRQVPGSSHAVPCLSQTGPKKAGPWLGKFANNHLSPVHFTAKVQV